MKETYEFLKECGVFYLATVDGNKPKVRPFGAVSIFEDKLYIVTGKKKNVSKQMSINPNIEICALKDGKWVRIEGEVLSDDRVEAKEAMLEANPSLKNMYSATDDNMEVLYFKNAKATYYSFVDAPKEIEF